MQSISRQYSISCLLESFHKLLGEKIHVRGRVSALRKMKKLTFVDIFSRNEKIQLQIKSDLSIGCAAGDLVEVEGLCILTKTGELTIDVIRLMVIGEWRASYDWKVINSIKQSSPLKSFRKDAYKSLFIPNLIRNLSRIFLNSLDFIEVQTPILTQNYNGGRSFPVETRYLNNVVGFNRGTMEERMQALIGSGFERIFQIGSVFRSDREMTFIESYMAYADYFEGENMVCDLLQFIAKNLVELGWHGGDASASTIDNLIKKNWLFLDFVDAASVSFSMPIVEVLKEGIHLPDFIYKSKITDTMPPSLEAAADVLANHIAKQFNCPVLIRNFPIWSSPLYIQSGFNNGVRVSHRARGYLPGQIGGFELGIQECDSRICDERISKQRELWNLNINDPRMQKSDLSTVISGGLPPIFGFAMNPDRLTMLWVANGHIDPFN